MLLYLHSSKCHDAGLKKKHRTEKISVFILSLNVKNVFCTFYLLWNDIIIIIIIVVIVLAGYVGFAVVNTIVVE